MQHKLSFLDVLNLVTFTVCSVALSAIVSTVFICAFFFVLGVLAYRSYTRFLSATGQTTVSIKAMVVEAVETKQEALTDAVKEVVNVVTGKVNKVTGKVAAITNNVVRTIDEEVTIWAYILVNFKKVFLASGKRLKFYLLTFVIIKTQF